MTARNLAFGLIVLVVLALALLISQTSFIGDSLAPFLYSLLIFVWELLNYISEITYWVTFSIISLFAVLIAMLGLATNWVGDDDDLAGQGGTNVPGPVERYTELMTHLDNSQFSQQQLSKELSRKLVAALERPEVKRRDIDQLLIDDAFDLSPMIADFLLDSSLSGQPVDEIIDLTIAHIEDILGIQHSKLESMA